MVRKSKDIIYEKDYIKKYRWERIRVGSTNRDVIEKFIEKEISDHKDFFERAVR